MIIISTLVVKDCLTLIIVLPINRFLSNLAPSFLIFNVHPRFVENGKELPSKSKKMSG